MLSVWFLLTAVGALPAKLLQVGSPADPLFGTANVKEVRLDTGDWEQFRDLVMPQEYFQGAEEVRHSAEEAKYRAHGFADIAERLTALAARIARTEDAAEPPGEPPPVADTASNSNATESSAEEVPGESMRRPTVQQQCRGAVEDARRLVDEARTKTLESATIFSGMAQRSRVLARPRFSVAFERSADLPLFQRSTLLPIESPDLEEALRELGIFTGSAVLRNSVEKAAIAAESDVPVLLLGETGTGKELFAKLVHRMSGRRGREMVTINCAAIPPELAESFLFGHLKGSFTGASHDQKGKFEQANGTTLFLDELGELSAAVQAKLLKVIEDGKVEPVGANSARTVSVRIVAATNRNLQEEVAAGRFRKDLYYRLSVVPIPLPPLRERPGEVARLAVELLKRINERYRKQRCLSKEALYRLEQHIWPGNVRELSNVLERSVLYSRSEVLGPDDLTIEAAPTADPLAGLPVPEAGFSMDKFLKQARRQLILRAMERSNGNQSAAAELLGISKQAVSKALQEQADNLD